MNETACQRWRVTQHCRKLIKNCPNMKENWLKKQLCYNVKLSNLENLIIKISYEVLVKVIVFSLICEVKEYL